MCVSVGVDVCRCGCGSEVGCESRNVDVVAGNRDVLVGGGVSEV